MNRLHPLSAVTRAFHTGVVASSSPFFALVVLSSIVDWIDVAWAFVLLPLGFLAGAAYGVASYYRFGYELTDDTIDVASGVFARRVREIPLRRIQNVDVTRRIFHRLFGVAVVTVETAGGGATEAHLEFVSDEEAARLQRDIRRLTATANGTAESRSRPIVVSDDPDPSGDSERSGPADRRRFDRSDAGYDALEADERQQPLFALALRELLRYSFTSVRAAAAAGTLFLAFFATDQVLEFLLASARPLGGPTDVVTASPRQYAILGLLSLLYGLAVTYLLSVAYTFQGYYDFRLGRVGDDLVYERGLLQRYSGSIPTGKIQSVTVTDNPLQRLLGYAGLWVETAGYGPESDNGSQSAVPLARSERVYWFAERLTGVDRPSFSRPPTVARRRYLVRYSLAAVAIVAVAFGISLETALERWWLAAVAFLAVPPAAHLRWAHVGYDVGEDHLVIRSGFWRRRTTVIPYYRVQTVSTNRTIFQRRLGLASLVVDTASSRTFFWDAPTIDDLEYEVASEIHDTSRERLQRALAERSKETSSGFGERDSGAEAKPNGE